MDKKSALRALQVIDSAILISARKGLNKNELVEFRSACNALVASIEKSAFATERAVWLIAAIEGALALKNDRLDSASRDFFLDYLIPLTLYIDSQPSSAVAPANASL